MLACQQSLLATEWPGWPSSNFACWASMRSNNTSLYAHLCADQSLPRKEAICVMPYNKVSAL